ncbi:MAG: thioredoxin family protein [Anaerolineae bacterium]|nr:thioredoxin family protein [Anaerolineae bacterium]
MALESDLVSADTVEATEFPQLAAKYRVQGVPRTVVNETIHFEGALPEGRLVAELKKKLAAA